MSELPKLIPITRREPPAGYVAPRYDSMPSVEEREAVLPYQAEELEAEDNARLAEAKRHAGYAMYTFRWWGLTNIILTIRMFIQAWRFRRTARKLSR